MPISLTNYALCPKRASTKRRNDGTPPLYASAIFKAMVFAVLRGGRAAEAKPRTSATVRYSSAYPNAAELEYKAQLAGMRLARQLDASHAPWETSDSVIWHIRIAGGVTLILSGRRWMDDIAALEEDGHREFKVGTFAKASDLWDFRAVDRKTVDAIVAQRQKIAQADPAYAAPTPGAHCKHCHCDDCPFWPSRELMT